MKPEVIIRTQAICDSTETQTRLCTAYIAYFGKGEYKSLNKFSWVDNKVLNNYPIKESCSLLLPSETDLYNMDWSKVPRYGKYDTDYPKDFLTLETHLPETHNTAY